MSDITSIKYRIKIKNKETNEIKIIFQNIIGLIDDLIDLNRWTVESADRFTGKRDIDYKDIYENDTIEYDVMEGATCVGRVFYSEKYAMFVVADNKEMAEKFCTPLHKYLNLKLVNGSDKINE